MSERHYISFWRYFCDEIEYDPNWIEAYFIDEEAANVNGPSTKTDVSSTMPLNERTRILKFNEFVYIFQVVQLF